MLVSPTQGRGRRGFLHGGRRLHGAGVSCPGRPLALCADGPLLICSVFLRLLLPRFSRWPDHLNKSRSGDWLDWQEKNRVHLLGWLLSGV